MSIHRTVPGAAANHLPTLLLGSFTDPEFEGVVSLLRGAVLHQRLQEAETLRAARELYPPGRQPPELVVICQTWSDQFTAEEIQGLIAWLPFARLICCHGPWCDSDGRTRDLWPLAVRISAAESVAVVADAMRELRSVGGQQSASPGAGYGSAMGGSGRLPLTASRAEIYAARFAHPDVGSLQSQRIVVNSPDRAWREMIETFVRSHRGEVLTAEPNTGHFFSRQPHWLIWDADPAGPARLRELDQWREACPRLQVLACVGFPRHDLTQSLRQQGMDAVWPKLAPLTELVELLGRDSGRK
ncbi:MAG: hypothetical protein ACK6D3_09765 [Planctomycetaceae bacterium]